MRIRYLLGTILILTMLLIASTASAQWSYWIPEDDYLQIIDTNWGAGTGTDPIAWGYFTDVYVAGSTTLDAMTTCDLKTDASGVIYCGTDAAGGAAGQFSTSTWGIYYNSGDVVLGNDATTTDAFWYNYTTDVLYLNELVLNTALSNANIASSTEFLVDTDTQLTLEQVQDHVWTAGIGTETLINVIYQDGTDDVDFIVVADLSQYDNSTSSFLTSYSETDPIWNAASSSFLTTASSTATYFTIAGANASNTAWLVDTDTQLTQAQVEDYAGGLWTGNTETLITITYQTGDNTLDAIVNNDLSQYSNATSGFLTSVAYSDLTGYPADVITAGDNVSWTASTTLNVADNWWNALTDMVLTDNYIYVGDASNDPVGVAMSNDCTIASDGAITCDHDVLDNYLEAEHIDWTSTSSSYGASIAVLDSTTTEMWSWGDHSLASYLTENQSITISGDATGSGTTSIAVSLSADSVADNEIDYSAVTLADFDYQTAWRLFYSNTDGDVTELGFATSTWVLTSSGLTSAPHWTAAGAGTVTSVDMSVPTGLTIGGNPITTSGTLALTYSAGYAIPLSASTTGGWTAYGWNDHSTYSYATTGQLADGCTDCLNATEIEDIYLLDGTSDTMTGTLTADGFTLGANESLTLGAQTLLHDGTDFVFNDTIAVSNDSISAAELNEGDTFTWTGTTHSFAGVTNLLIPGVADADGEIAIDKTNDDQLVYYGDVANVLTGFIERCFSLEGASSTDLNVPIWSPHRAIAITDIYCRVRGASSTWITISDGTNELEGVACDEDGQADDGSIANGAFTADEEMQFDVGTTTNYSADSWTNVCITYTITAD